VTCLDRASQSVSTRQPTLGARDKGQTSPIITGYGKKPKKKRAIRFIENLPRIQLRLTPLLLLSFDPYSRTPSTPTVFMADLGLNSLERSATEGLSITSHRDLRSRAGR
jgi:hypothetical protein